MAGRWGNGLSTDINSRREGRMDEGQGRGRSNPPWRLAVFTGRIERYSTPTTPDTTLDFWPSSLFASNAPTSQITFNPSINPSLFLPCNSSESRSRKYRLIDIDQARRRTRSVWNLFRARAGDFLIARLSTGGKWFDFPLRAVTARISQGLLLFR